jgi:hypothetical protein
MDGLFAGSVSFSTHRAQLYFGGESGLFVQRIHYEITQSVSRLYEAGRRDVYLVGGPIHGRANLERVLGPKSTTAGFYRKFGDIPQTPQSLKVTSDSPQIGGLQLAGSVQMSGSIITTIGTVNSALDFVETASATMLFLNVSSDR